LLNPATERVHFVMRPRLFTRPGRRHVPGGNYGVDPVSPNLDRGVAAKV
jgi:hypothetical protein